MGSTDQPAYSEDSWSVARIAPQFNLLKNRFTGEQVRQYEKVLTDCRSQQLEQRVWDKRMLMGENVVKILSTQKLQSFDQCCSSQVRNKIYTEHTQVTLAESEPLESKQGVALLNKVLSGFNQITKLSNKYFLVNDRLISFTAKGSPKVWLHQNYAENTPADEMQRTSNPQSSMVLSVVQAVHKNVKDGLPVPLLQRLQSRLPLSFSKALNIVNNKSVDEDQSRSGLRPSERNKDLILNLYKGPGSNIKL